MTRAVFLAGEKIDLCPVSSDADLSRYVAWINDQETTRWMATGKRPQTDRQLRDFIDRYNSSGELLLGIVVRETGRHVGNITLHQVDAQNRTAEIGILIGEPECRGKGYGAEALRLLVDHAFRRLNLNRLTAGMVAGNESSRKLFEKIGFRREGTLREAFYLDGTYHDVLRYGLLRREFLTDA